MRFGRYSFVLAIFFGTVAAADTASIIQQNEDAVVVILGTKMDSGASVQGSGCFVSETGLILTTAHQVTGVGTMKAKTRDGREFPADVVAVDKPRELALLRATVSSSKAARIGDAQTLKNGAPLVGIASPMNLDFSAITGIVSNTNRMYQGFPVIQASLQAGPGSSGGPVFDEEGLLVGIIIGKLEGQDWITIVNPVNNAYDMLRANGVPLADSPTPFNGASEDAIIPLDGITRLEREAIALYNRGVSATTPAEKAEAYGAAVKLLPGFYEAWFNLAVAKTATRQPSAALEAYRRASELRPDAVAPLRNLGRLLLKEKRFDEAVQSFERVVSIAANDAQTHNDLGEAYRQSGRLADAVRSFREALRLDPGRAATQFNLGLTLAAMGQNHEALSAFENYLKTSPDASDTQQVEQWIAELKATPKGATP